MVGGHYQAGTWVVDFANPAAARTVAWSDPPALVPADLGGAWLSYWYNDRIYESEITKGLNVFRLHDRVVRHAIRLDHLNPETQEFSLAGTSATDTGVSHRVAPGCIVRSGAIGAVISLRFVGASLVANAGP